MVILPMRKPPAPFLPSTWDRLRGRKASKRPSEAKHHSWPRVASCMCCQKQSLGQKPFFTLFTWRSSPWKKYDTVSQSTEPNTTQPTRTSTQGLEPRTWLNWPLNVNERHRVKGLMHLPVTDAHETRGTHTPAGLYACSGQPWPAQFLSVLCSSQR